MQSSPTPSPCERGLNQCTGPRRGHPLVIIKEAWNNCHWSPRKAYWRWTQLMRCTYHVWNKKKFSCVSVRPPLNQTTITSPLQSPPQSSWLLTPLPTATPLLTHPTSSIPSIYPLEAVSKHLHNWYQAMRCPLVISLRLLNLINFVPSVDHTLSSPSMAPIKYVLCCIFLLSKC